MSPRTRSFLLAALALILLPASSFACGPMLGPSSPAEAAFFLAFLFVGLLLSPFALVLSALGPLAMPVLLVGVALVVARCLRPNPWQPPHQQAALAKAGLADSGGLETSGSRLPGDVRTAALVAVHFGLVTVFLLTALR